MRAQKPYAKLRGKITEKYNTQGVFADAMNRDRASINQKLCGRIDWTRKEMQDACDVLDIPTTEVYDYFFAN